MIIDIKKQKGFTLVELAIVLVIVGLLIGGILKGQKLLLNAKVTATVAQIKGIEAATTNFRDVYGALPGDLKNSYVKVAGCTSVPYCGDATHPGSNGDGSIGESDWDMSAYQGDAATNCVVGGGACTQGRETLLYWYSLQMAGLISGVTSEIINPTGTAGAIRPAFGRTLPSSKIGGGFWVGNSLNGVLGGNGDKYTLFGTVLSLIKSPTGGAGNLLDFTSKQNVTTPAVAANIDRKLDDGLPASGSVQAYGFADTCFGGTGSHQNAYQESITNLDCGVHIRIQK